MTGYQSKKAAALDEEGMYLVHHTKHKIDEDDDDTQVYKRPWVGLTEEEIDDIFWQHESQTEHQVPIYPYERAIEAKLKEKNNA